MKVLSGHKKQVKDKIKYVLGGSRLSSEYYLFLTVHTLFLIFTKIPGVFINTLLMNQTRSVNAVLFYNGSIFTACAVTMLFSAQIMHKKGCRFTAAAGIGSYTVLYLCYVLLQAYVGEYYLLFGLCNGIADGFYYISYGSMVLAYTDISNRDSGMGIISILGAGVNLAVPFLSGTVISVVGGVKGYVTIFAIAFGIALMAVCTVFRLPKDEMQQSAGVHYIAFVKKLRQNREVCLGLLGETMKGIREGTFMFILNLVLYQFIKSEFLIGCNSLMTGVVSIGSFWIISHFFRPNNRLRYMLLAVCGLSGVALICFWILNPAMVIFYAAVNAFLAGMLEVSCYSIFFDVSQNMAGIEDFAPELLAFHEVSVVSGRCLGLLGFAAVNYYTGATLKAQMFSLLVLTLLQFVTVAVCRRTGIDSIGIQAVDQ